MPEHLQFYICYIPDLCTVYRATHDQSPAKFHADQKSFTNFSRNELYKFEMVTVTCDVELYLILACLGC